MDVIIFCLIYTYILRFLWLLGLLQDLYKLNFRVISQEVNMIQGPGKDGLYNFVEVVFMKDNVWN